MHAHFLSSKVKLCILLKQTVIELTIFSNSFVHNGVVMKLTLKELSKPVELSEVITWCLDPITEKSTGTLLD